MKKQFLAIAAAVCGLVSSAAAAQQGPAPYYTASGNRGAQFWNWTSGTIDDAEAQVQQKMADSGQSIENFTQGFYATDSQNDGDLRCLQGSRQVSGFGAQVFDNAVSLVQSQRLSGCTININTSGNPFPGPDPFPGGDSAPFYTGASNRGAQYWSWTLPSLQEEIDFVRGRIAAAGQRLDHETQGFYRLNGQNFGTMFCLQGSREISGFGAQVFETGVSIVQSQRLSGCTFQLRN